MGPVLMAVSPAAVSRPCLKCKRMGTELIETRKDLYCRDCFLIFTKSKYRRGMDAFRAGLDPAERNNRMLLALSGGLSSSVLVDLAYTAIARTRGKYEMPVILHVSESGFSDCDQDSKEAMIAYLKENYPDIRFIERQMDEIDQYLSSFVPLGTEEHVRADGGASQATTLRACLAALPSNTSQEDVLALYRDRLILETAKEQQCSAIIFGNSATSLAAKTLSLTAKGRGYALPWETADHSLSHSGIWSVRPMKGLMATEIQKYANLIGLPSSNTTRRRSGKASSIDDLTQRYFENLEAQFPSLVATVVRTTNKLVEPVSREKALGDCKICGMTYQDGARKWLRDITVDEAAPLEQLSAIATNGAGTEETEDFCYGCVVALRGVRSNVNWPTFEEHAVRGHRKHDKESVLDEFELQEEEM